MKQFVCAFLKSAEISPVTLLSYQRDLENFLSCFPSGLSSVTEENLVKFFEEMAKKSSPSSFSRLVSVIRSFVSYLEKEGKIAENPMKNIRAKDFSQKESVVLTEEEWERLMTYSVPGFRGIRDQAMLFLLGETGIRVSELVGLSRGDVSKGSLLCGEGAHKRVLSLSPRVSRKLEDYLILSALYLENPCDSDPLFITAKGGRLTRQGFWKNLKDRAIFCGIDKSISPHTLRRSFAIKLLESGCEKEEIRQKLGNLDTASLRTYHK